jgi:hypothetical protein
MRFRLIEAERRASSPSAAGAVRFLPTAPARRPGHGGTRFEAKPTLALVDVERGVARAVESARSARSVPVEVGDFYGMAAS